MTMTAAEKQEVTEADEVITRLGGSEGTRAKIAELEKSLYSPRVSPQKKVENRILLTQLEQRLVKEEPAG